MANGKDGSSECSASIVQAWPVGGRHDSEVIAGLILGSLCFQQARSTMSKISDIVMCSVVDYFLINFQGCIAKAREFNF